MVEIKANIKENGLGKWFISVEDSFEEKNYSCEDMESFANLLEELSHKYKGQLNVLWSKDENLSQKNFTQVQAQMAKLKERLESQGS